ncbi:hypothetical protein ACWF9G_32595 [Nocardia sp. NPDC055029]|uniref:hypothetical protein n=1 Tax=Nocardia sp. NPDC060259 TaxID=3347088 RepID=UPI00365C0810
MASSPALVSLCRRLYAALGQLRLHTPAPTGATAPVSTPVSLILAELHRVRYAPATATIRSRSGHTLTGLRMLTVHPRHTTLATPNGDRLVRIEHTTAIDSIGPDGQRRTDCDIDPFGIIPTAIGWRLLPAHRDDHGDWVIAGDAWAASSTEAGLPDAVTKQAVGAPRVVPVHDRDPHTGSR